MLYGVTTKRLNEQVKRNKKRFPEDFIFQLTKSEKGEVVANCDHLKSLKFSRTRRYAFTEHGAIMVANILNSDRCRSECPGCKSFRPAKKRNFDSSGNCSSTGKTRVAFGKAR